MHEPPVTPIAIHRNAMMGCHTLLVHFSPRIQHETMSVLASTQLRARWVSQLLCHRNSQASLIIPHTAEQTKESSKSNLVCMKKAFCDSEI